MKLRGEFTRCIRWTRHRAAQMANRSRGNARGALHQIVKRWRSLTPQEQRALTHFARPQLYNRGSPAFDLFQPLVAVAALMALMFAAGLGVASLMLLGLAGWIIYAILTHIFGLEFELGLPQF